MNGKLLAPAVYIFAASALIFALGFSAGGKPSQCSVLSYKLDAIETFCSNIVDQAIEANCPADMLEEKDLEACRGIVAIRAMQGCDSLTQKSEIALMIEKGC